MTLPVSADPQRWGGAHTVYDKASGGGAIDKRADFVPPYVSAKHDSPTVNNNGKYKFAEKFATDAVIYCRHFVMTFILDIFYNEKAKVIASQFSGDEIQKHVDVRTDSLMARVRTHSPQVLLIKNDNFGKELTNMFEGMAAGDVRACMLFMPDHVMGVKLHIKEEDGGIKRVVTFYDPNSTGTWVRTAEKILPDSTEPSEISKLTTKDFLGEDRDIEYFGESNTSALVPVDKSFLESIEAQTLDLSKPTRAKLAKRDFDEHTINSIHIFHITQFHLHESLMDLLPMFKLFSASKIENLLSAEIGGWSALAELILIPCEKTLAAYKKLLELLPSERQFNLILNAANDLAKNRFNLSPSDAAKTVAMLATLKPKEHQEEFLIDLTEKLIGDALENNSSKTIETCSALLDLMPEKARIAILEGVIDSVHPKEDSASISAFGSLIKLIPEGDARLNLIKTMTKNGIGKFLNLERSKPEVVAEKVKLLELVSPGHRMALCVPKYALHLSELFKEFNAAPEKNKAAFMSVLVGTFDKLDASQKFQMLKVFDKLNLSDQFIEANVSASGMHSGDEVFLHAST